MKPNLTQLDWARLAAYIDGEGSICITRGKAKTWKHEMLYVTLTVTNTDPRLTLWCAETFGGRVYGHSNNKYARKNPRWSSCTYWTVGCKTAARLIEGCLPYFILKKEQAEVALAFQKTLGGPGRAVTPEIWAKRYELKSALSKLKGTSSRSGLPPRDTALTPDIGTGRVN